MKWKHLPESDNVEDRRDKDVGKLPTFSIGEKLKAKKEAPPEKSKLSEDAGIDDVM